MLKIKISIQLIHEGVMRCLKKESYGSPITPVYICVTIRA